MNIKDYLQHRLQAKVRYLKYFLGDKALKAGTGAVIQVGAKVYPALNGALHKKARHKYYSFPPVSLDDVLENVLRWQVQFDGKATKQGVLNHLKEELNEVQESNFEANEVADLWVLLIHLTALCNLDPSIIILEKLQVLEKRNYDVSPDAEGKIKHAKV